MKRILVALLESGLTAIYWWLVATLSFGLFGGSRNPLAAPPGRGEVLVQTGAIVIVAIVVYAMLSLLWQKLVRPRLF
ncbi:hypothetical protein [Sphingomonas sp.]|uniref:hypothetical protein n=1 Tax=Sphingomonas sp. TaxID=28214 RepID=UPI00289C90AE|nr:hypothetical protein [Sphingomonas sp.]